MGKKDYEALAIILLIVAAIILDNTFLPGMLGSTGYLYIFRPVFWFLLSFYVWKQPRTKFKGKLKLYKYILIWSGICGILYLTVFFLCGFLDGIGISPYAKSFQGILLNSAGFGSVVVMMEWVRNYIINRVKKKFVVLFSIITVIVYTLYKLNLRIAFNISSWQQFIQYTGEYILPEVFINIFLTYLVYIGGPYPSIIYSAITAFPVWIVPVLPNLKWITKAFIGIIAPVAFLLVIRKVYKKRTKEIRLSELKKENPYSWIAISVFSILLIWFTVGVFPVFPTVVLTGSMQPAINPGDVVLIQKSEGENIKTGDVIQYWTGRIFIVHRVIEADEAAGKFRTKGDNNSVADSMLVSKEQIRGRVIGVIPKIGKISLWLRSNKNIPKEQVEF